MKVFIAETYQCNLDLMEWHLCITHDDNNYLELELMELGNEDKRWILEMILKNKIKEIVSRPEHIPGIYNYCDRWCDRCDKTHACTNFAIGVSQFPDPDSNDPHSAKFWNQLDEVFKATIEMLQEMADVQGVDLSAIDLDAAEVEDKHLIAVAEDHICSKMSQSYIKLVNCWFGKNQSLFDHKCDELERLEAMDLPNTDPAEEVERLNDDIEVIRWYQTQIFVKLMRAVEGVEMFSGEAESINDSDGSAKVALLAVERSTAAWADLRRSFPTQADEILDILIFLQRLCKKIEEFFPNARSFIRPGFDD